MPRSKDYHVFLTPEQRGQLEHQIHCGKGSARLLDHLRVLLKADEGPGGPAWTDAAICAAVEVSQSTVSRIRRAFHEGGLEGASRRRVPSRTRSRRLDGRAEAHLIALACSAPPAGQRRWTLRLLADRMVERELVDTLSYETVPQTLKKELKPWQVKRWCIPPTRNGEFVAGMEDVLEVDCRLEDPVRPRVCLDEQPLVLHGEIRPPLPAAPARGERPGQPARQDYEWTREGTASLFMLYAPGLDWRQVEIRKQRTKRDFAEVIKDLVDVHLPLAERIVLVMGASSLTSARRARGNDVPPPRRRLGACFGAGTVGCCRSAGVV